MKCLTCNNEVSSKFAFAISSNICPFCGKAIMHADLQKVLSGLRETMTLATEKGHDEQALSWFASNYNLVSRESEEYAELHKTIEQLTSELKTAREKMTKPIPRSGARQVEASDIQLGVDENGDQVQLNGPAIQNENDTQAFMERANSKLTDKNAKLKKLVSQIKGGGTLEGGNMAVTPDMLARADADEVSQMEEMIFSEGAPIIASGIVNNGYDDGDSLPPVAEAFIAGGGGGGQKQSYNQKDMETLAKMQQKMARERSGTGGRPSFAK